MQNHYIDVIEDKNELVIWSKDENDELHVERQPLKDYLYCFMKDNSGSPDMKSFKKEDLKRVNFNTKRELKDFSDRSDLFESDILPRYKVLLDYFKEPIEPKIINALFFDIEVDFDLEDGRGYPQPDNPFGEVNSIQFFSTKLNEYFVYHKCDEEFHLEDSEYPVSIVKCNSERQLLREFANFMDEVDVDYITGWFSSGYDLPYLIHRAIEIFGETKGRKLFCRGDFSAKVREYFDENGNELIRWTLVGRHHVDYMELYKKFMPGERKWSLDSICEEDLGENKVSYDGDLGELYRDNPQKYFEYALHDARLLKWLDNKHNILAMAVNLARINSSFVPDVVASVKPIEMGFIKFCHERGYAVQDKRDHNKEKFKGAIVYPTKNGRHGWAFTIDLTALYPSAMIMLGLSTETVVGQLTEGYMDYIKVMGGSTDNVHMVLEDDGDTYELSAQEVKNIITENGYTISANGTIFNGELGLLSEYVKNRFELRKEYQKISKESEDKSIKEIYNLYQKVMKIICNSLYGCISNASFRLFDIRLARSITMTGQIISKWQAYKGNQYVEGLKA